MLGKKKKKTQSINHHSYTVKSYATNNVSAGLSWNHIQYVHTSPSFSTRNNYRTANDQPTQHVRNWIVSAFVPLLMCEKKSKNPVTLSVAVSKKKKKASVTNSVALDIPTEYRRDGLLLLRERWKKHSHTFKHTPTRPTYVPPGEKKGKLCWC